MSRIPASSLSRLQALTVALAALAPLACLAQSNAPLTGSMTSGAPAATAPAAAALPQAQLPPRPVVQQVQTPMPQPAAAATTSQPQAQAAAAAPSSASASAPPPAAEENFGDITRALLTAQADGRRAGGALPILGPVSTAAWNRYMDSFSHPIPDFFQKRVQTKNTN